MSYARFSDGDVYVFTAGHGIECCGCRLAVQGDPDPYYTSNQGMIDHLLLHRLNGHRVPEYALEQLRDPADEAENKAIWAALK